ncbi:hypothetical protein AHAS_Ahas05G0050000 [Arachis hypogaea]
MKQLYDAGARKVWVLRSINVANGCCGTGLDYKIDERIEQEGKGCVIVVNKWDTIPNKNQQTATYYEQDVREKLRILDWAPIVYSTAIVGHSVDKSIIMVDRFLGGLKSFIGVDPLRELLIPYCFFEQRIIDAASEVEKER